MVLERLGGGGDDGAPLGKEGRYEVGKRLAGARAGLDGEVVLSSEAVDDLGHGTGHGFLAGAPLAAVGQVGGDLFEGDSHLFRIHAPTVPVVDDTGAVLHRGIGASR